MSQRRNILVGLFVVLASCSLIVESADTVSHLIPMSTFYTIATKPSTVFPYKFAVDVRAFVGFASATEINLLRGVVFENTATGVKTVGDQLAAGHADDNTGLKKQFTFGKDFTVTTNLTWSQASQLTNYLFITDNTALDVYDALFDEYIVKPSVIFNVYNSTLLPNRRSTIFNPNNVTDISVFVLEATNMTLIINSTMQPLNRMAMTVPAYRIDLTNPKPIVISPVYAPPNKNDNFTTGEGALTSDSYPNATSLTFDEQTQRVHFAGPMLVSTQLDVYLRAEDFVQLTAWYNADSTVFYRVSGNNGWITLTTKDFVLDMLELKFWNNFGNGTAPYTAYRLIYVAEVAPHNFGEGTLAPSTVEPTTKAATTKVATTKATTEAASTVTATISE